ncbi:MAG: hypothetical protein SGPRY_001932 [Prymnesium sp.]
MEERYDEVLLNVAGQCGGIEPLFEVIFSFLYRKTDFFHIMQPGDKMGFPEGVAEKLLLRNFRRFETMAKSAVVQREAAKKEAKANASSVPSLQAPPSANKPTTAVPPVCDPRSRAIPKPPLPPSSSVDGAERGSQQSTTVVEASEATLSRGHLKEFVDVPYNGSSTSKYSWEQTINDVTINVPKGTKARDVICVIGKSHLMLKLKGETAPILDADFPCDARNGKEIWEKERETWWKSALHGEEEIDTTKVDSTRSMYDYDEETQGAIRKIMFDQDQKRKGLPSSDDMKVSMSMSEIACWGLRINKGVMCNANQDLLKKAWDAEGSPFKGTPFDPQAINLNGGGV